MDSFIQQQNRLRQRRQQKNYELARGAPFIGVTVGDHQADKEHVQVSYHAGARSLTTLHPYMGSDSWIRVGAEAGIPVVMANRIDANTPEILKYAFRQPIDRINAYTKDKLGLYRPLSPGEIEIHSKGTAQSHYSRRPRVEHRGGMIRSWLDQDDLEAGSRAPVHIRQLHLNKGGNLGDEERFGVVQRPDQSGIVVSKVWKKFVRAERLIDPVFGAEFAASAIAAGIVTEPGPWAKEHTRILSTGAALPSKLIDIREGDVIDDFGDVLNMSLTGNPLRFKGEWFCDNILGGAFFVGIDSDGNFSVQAPDAATTGGQLTIPQGDLIVQIGASHGVTVQTDYTLSTVEGGVNIESNTDMTVRVVDGSIVMQPSTRMDVGQADEPAVLGNVALNFFTQLIDLLVSHVHTGNTGAPTPLDPGAIAQLNQLKADFITNPQLVSDYINFSKQP